MSAAHTSGPWFAAALRTHGANPKMDGCDIGAENGANVALVLHQSGDRSEAETIANARIIAAAPALLEACLAIVEWDEAENNAKPFTDDGGAGFYARIGMCREAFEKAHAAIALTTGPRAQFLGMSNDEQPMARYSGVAL